MFARHQTTQHVIDGPTTLDNLEQRYTIISKVVTAGVVARCRRPLQRPDKITGTGRRHDSPRLALIEERVEMPKVFVSTVINAPIERVWRVVSDFNGLPAWMPGMKDSVIEGKKANEIGAVRRLSMAGSKDSSARAARSACRRRITGSPTRCSRGRCR